MTKSNGNSPKPYSKFTEEDIRMLGLRQVSALPYLLGGLQRVFDAV